MRISRKTDHTSNAAEIIAAITPDTSNVDPAVPMMWDEFESVGVPSGHHGPGANAKKARAQATAPYPMERMIDAHVGLPRIISQSDRTRNKKPTIAKKLSTIAKVIML